MLHEINGCIKDYNEKYSIGIPDHIGCGLGGGDWRIVKTMIEVIFENSPLDVYIVKNN